MFPPPCGPLPKIAKPSPIRRRRSSQEILGLQNHAPEINASENDEDEKKPTILITKNLNVSAGGTFYEKAKSRRGRHAKALAEHSHEAIALRRSSSEGSRGPNGTANTSMYRHCKGELDPEKADEVRFQQQADLRMAKIRQFQRELVGPPPPPPRQHSFPVARRVPAAAATTTSPRKKPALIKERSARANVVDLTRRAERPIQKNNCPTASSRPVAAAPKEAPKRKTVQAKYMCAPIPRKILPARK